MSRSRSHSSRDRGWERGFEGRGVESFWGEAREVEVWICVCVLECGIEIGVLWGWDWRVGWKVGVWGVVLSWDCWWVEGWEVETPSAGVDVLVPSGITGRPAYGNGVALSRLCSSR